MKPSATICLGRSVGQLVILAELALGMAKDQFAHLAGGEWIVVIIDDLEIHSTDRPAHRPDPTDVVEQESR